MKKLIAGILLRHSLSAVGAILAARGLLTTEQASQADMAAETFTGAVMVLVGLGLSALQKRKAASTPKD